MKFTVVAFASIRDICGFDSTPFELSAGATVEDFLSQIYIEHPQLIAEKVLVAINKSYATIETEINDGDEVAIFPPVSGG